jgi:hypothetical protein
LAKRFSGWTTLVPTCLSEATFVIPAKVGIPVFQVMMDSCFRRNDAHWMALPLNLPFDKVSVSEK